MSARQRGAALLLAMLTVTLVATLAASAMWRQWRGIAVEESDRTHAQLAWLLTGALDWSRLILREDSRAGQVDHLSEPWALALSESRLSTFLAQDRNNTQDAPEAFLSGQITDQQARLNVLNLVDKGKLSDPAWNAFVKLFRLLSLPQSELSTLAENLRLSSLSDAPPAHAPLPPQRVRDLARFGLSPVTLRALAPHITVLPARTAVNLNTAGPEVVAAVLPGLDLAQAQLMITRRASAHFRDIADILRESGVPAARVDTTLIGVSSNYFEVFGRLRVEQSTTQERSLIARQGLVTEVLWREREVLFGPPGDPASRPASY